MASVGVNLHQEDARISCSVYDPLRVGRTACEWSLTKDVLPGLDARNNVILTNRMVGSDENGLDIPIRQQTGDAARKRVDAPFVGERPRDLDRSGRNVNNAKSTGPAEAAGEGGGDSACSYDPPTQRGAHILLAR